MQISPTDRICFRLKHTLDKQVKPNEPSRNEMLAMHMMRARQPAMRQAQQQEMERRARIEQQRRYYEQVHRNSDDSRLQSMTSQVDSAHASRLQAYQQRMQPSAAAPEQTQPEKPRDDRVRNHKGQFVKPKADAPEEPTKQESPADQ